MSGDIANFLGRFRPDGVHVLTSIIPDGKTETKSFANPAEAEAWALAQNGMKRNVYFHVNPTLRALDNKASKADIASVDFLHVDIDPRTGEDETDEQTRILHLLTTELPPGIPEPSLIVFSGNGYQALWRLAEPIAIDGDIAKATEAERYNRQLEKVFQADNCHNVDRLLRLPGTINYPNKKKRANGRVAANAEVHCWHDSAPHLLSTFTPASTTTDKARSTSPKHAAPMGLGVGGPMGTKELEAWATANGRTIPPHPLAVMVNGVDPLEADKYPSRSEALWAVCCGLARAGVPDDLIAAAIADPNNAVSASVRDKPKPEAYAWNQVTKARAEVDREYREQAEIADNDLAEMNRRHAVIVSGKVRVLSWRKTHPKIDRSAPDIQTFEDFANRYRHKRVIAGFNEKGQPVEKPKGRWWLEHPRRREIAGLCFDPGEGSDVDGFQNLWRGWGVDPKPGNWSLMREHIRTVLANGEKASDEYIVRWAAWAVQNPGKQAEAALVFRGGRGTGKGFFGRALKDLFGQHGLHIKSTKHLTGDFNLHLRDCCLLFADEALAPGDKGAESRLKGLITEPDLTIEGKGVDLVTEPNHLHVIMASNENWVVPAGTDERRFAVFNVSNTRQQDEEYFAALDVQLRESGLAAMLHDLMAMDLGDWHPRHSIPQTGALRAQKVESLDGFEAFVFDLLSTGGFPMVTTLTAGGEFVASEDLRTAAADWLKSHSGNRQLTHQKIAELMTSLGAKRYRRGGGGNNGFLLPELATMRANWDAQHFKWAWLEEPEQKAAEGKPPF